MYRNGDLSCILLLAMLYDSGPRVSNTVGTGPDSITRREEPLSITIGASVHRGTGEHFLEDRCDCQSL